MRSTPLVLVLGLTLAACAKDPPPSQYPQQQGGYPQQQGGYPQQQPYPQQPPPQTAPPQATPAAAGSGTPTAIPGVTKNADGTCSLTPPSLTGQPVAPLVGPCPPGI